MFWNLKTTSDYKNHLMTFRLFKVHSTSNGLFNYASLHPWYKILARSCYSTMVWFQKIKFLKEIFYDLLSPDMALITENFRRCASWKIRQHMSITMIDDKTITMFLRIWPFPSGQAYSLKMMSQWEHDAVSGCNNFT